MIELQKFKIRLNVDDLNDDKDEDLNKQYK